MRILPFAATALLLVQIASAQTTTTTTTSPAVDDDLASRAYAGLLLRDDPVLKLPLVSWVNPGPFEGRGPTSPRLNRGDTVLSINGKVLNAKQFRELIDSLRAGDELVLRVNKTGSPEVTAVPTTFPSKGEVEVRVKLASRGEWCGPVAFARDASREPKPEAIVALPEGPTSLEKFLDAPMRDNHLVEPVTKLYALFAQLQDRARGRNSLHRVEYGFYRPARLPQLVQRITEPMPTIPPDPRRVLTIAAENLDLAAPAVSDAPPNWTDFAGVMAWTRQHLLAADAKVKLAMKDIDPKTRETLAGDLDFLLTEVAHGRVSDSHDPRRVVRALQSSMRVDHAMLLAAAGELAGAMQRAGSAPAPTTQNIKAEMIAPPDALKGIVTGGLLAAEQTDAGWIVYGGVGPNTYDMSKLAAVIDLGGDDTYRYSDATRPAVQLIVDFAGDDDYESPATLAGPASALLGVNILVDHAGNDRYAGGNRSCGVGVMGVGLLVDYAGDDTYTGKSWSCGAGFYGVGAILELGGTGDVYFTDSNSQAIGGPRGFGLIVDAGGNDFYRANSGVGSAYGDAAIFYGMSQGVGLGLRDYDTGGIGVLEDFGGADRYEAGEFSQGGGYYFGLGILHDRGGDDLYFSHRYSQGYGCHQAIGALVDDSGDDTYWATTGANQGGAWDVAMGMLLDRDGNDTYHAGGLAQGSAAMQGVGWLIDLGGTDHYVGGKDYSLGQGGGNSYRYFESGCLSFSLFIDAGGTNDFYSTERPNGQTLSTGKFNEAKPEDSGLHGLYIDTPTKIDVMGK